MMAGALLMWAAWVPATANAWTDAAVRTVHAQVEIGPDAMARVTLQASVRIHGGWLEGLELAGLDEDLALVEGVEPWAMDEGGARYRPRLTLRDGGRVQIDFPGRSPRRGTVTIGFVYQTSLAHRGTEPLEGEDRVRVSWTLPGWSAGLDGVQIELLAPEGSEMGPRAESDSGAELEESVEPLDGQVLMRWRRAHLPRTTAWTVSADVPADQMHEALRGPPSLPAPPPPRSAAAAAADPAPFWFALAALVALLGLFKLLTVRILARRSRSLAPPLVPMPIWVRVPLLLFASALGGWLGPTLGIFPAFGALAVAVLLAVVRPGPTPPPSRLGAWRPADARWIAASRRAFWRRAIAPSGALDATTPLGALHACLWIALPVSSAWIDWPVGLDALILAAALPLPLLGTGTVLSFPRGPAETLRALLAFVGKRRALPDGVALRPVMHVDVRGEVQDARVRTVLPRRPRGLLRLDLAVAQLPHAGGWDAELCLVVVTRAESAAEKALTDALPELSRVESRGGRRVLRRLPLERLPLERWLATLGAIAEALARCPEAPAAARGVASHAETVRDLPAPRAVGL